MVSNHNPLLKWILRCGEVCSHMGNAILSLSISTRHAQLRHLHRLPHRCKACQSQKNRRVRHGRSHGDLKRSQNTLGVCLSQFPPSEKDNTSVFFGTKDNAFRIVAMFTHGLLGRTKPRSIGRPGKFRETSCFTILPSLAICCW